MKTLVDSPEAGNPFEKAFAPWPIRFFIIMDGIVQYIAISPPAHGALRNCSVPA